MLCIAWAEKDTSGEIRAYFNLAIDNFYNGDMQRAEFYQDRYMRGKTENHRSIPKQVAINQMKPKLRY